jgi:multicomponent K+:H+ antiporter subunit D
MSRLEGHRALMPHLMLAPIALPMATAALMLLLREERSA